MFLVQRGKREGVLVIPSLGEKKEILTGRKGKAPTSSSEGKRGQEKKGGRLRKREGTRPSDGRRKSRKIILFSCRKRSQCSIERKKKGGLLSYLSTTKKRKGGKKGGDLIEKAIDIISDWKRR